MNSKKAFVFLCSIVGLFFITSLVGRLISSPSDMGVGLGIGIVLLLVLGAIKYMAKISVWLEKLVPLFLIGVLCTSAGCGWKRIAPGEVGIRVNLAGSNRGAENIPIVTGWVFYNPFTESIYEFPTYQQNVIWTQSIEEGSPTDESITFNGSEGSAINVDLALSYSLDPNKVPHLFVHYRSDIHTITHKYIRNEVRDILTKKGPQYTTMDIMGPKRQELLEDLKNGLRERLEEKGFLVEMIGFIGKPRIDSTIEKRINEAIAQTQATIAAENRVKQVEAEAKQKIAEADGQAQSQYVLVQRAADANLYSSQKGAEANKAIANSLTPEFLKWMALQKWDGKVPVYSGSGVVPFVELGK